MAQLASSLLGIVICPPSNILNLLERIPISSTVPSPVSYTHLDVYKRQVIHQKCAADSDRDHDNRDKDRFHRVSLFLFSHVILLFKYQQQPTVHRDTVVFQRL